MNLTVKRVWRDIQGSPLTADVSIGATSITVEESVDFDEDGGTLTIDSETVAYSAVDEDTNTITVTALAAAHSKGAFVQEGERRGPKYADGYLDDSDQVTESVLIPSHLRRFFPLEGREAADMEVVPVALAEDGSLYVTDAPIDEDRADAPVVFTWSLTGNVSVGTRDHRFAMPFGGSIEEVRMVMGDGGAPTGSSIIVDILKGGASILTDKVTVAAGELSSDPIEPTDKEASKGNIIQIEFEQVGSTLPGSDPTLYMTVFPSETAISGRVEVPGMQGPAGADGVITEVQNEGVALADQPIMNFTGAGVNVTVAGGKYVVDVSSGGGGAPTTADYLVGTANGSLSAEIVVGTTPGGELGGTWASPTVDATHSGSSHASVQAAAEATAATALSTHEADTTSVHGIANTADILLRTLADAKGDLLAATAADTIARLAVGSDFQHLRARAGATAGIEWAALATAAEVATAESTTSASYTDLTTPGPAVTVTTGTAALVIVTARVSNNTAGGQSFMGFAVSGASTIAGSDVRALSAVSAAADQRYRLSRVVYVSTLTAGSNTFTAKFAQLSGTATFAERQIVVIPL